MISKHFQVFAVPLFTDNYSYILYSNRQQPLVLVDPAHPQIIMQTLNRYFSEQQIGHILYTHKHWDHAGGSVELLSMLSSKWKDIKIYSGIQDAIDIKTVNYSLPQDTELNLGDWKVNTYKVPCHTRGHTVYHFSHFTGKSQKLSHQEMATQEGRQIHSFESSECAFTGDTLFCGGVGRFFQGNADEMHGNLRKINDNLPELCDIFNGHEYTLANLQWGALAQPDNHDITQYLNELKKEQGIRCTLPSNLKRQRKINVFLRAVTEQQNKYKISSVSYLSMLRQAKNSNSAALSDFIPKI